MCVKSKLVAAESKYYANPSTHPSIHPSILSLSHGINSSWSAAPCSGRCVAGRGMNGEDPTLQNNYQMPGTQRTMYNINTLRRQYSYMNSSAARKWHLYKKKALQQYQYVHGQSEEKKANAATRRPPSAGSPPLPLPSGPVAPAYPFTLETKVGKSRTAENVACFFWGGEVLVYSPDAVPTFWGEISLGIKGGPFVQQWKGFDIHTLRCNSYTYILHLYL